MKKNIIISVLIIIIGGLLVYIGYDNFIKVDDEIKVNDEFKTNNEEQDNMLIIPYKEKLAGIYETDEIFHDNKVQITLNGNDIILDYNKEENVLYFNAKKINLTYYIEYFIITADYVVGFHQALNNNVLSILIDENGKTIDLMDKTDLQFSVVKFYDYSSELYFGGYPWCGDIDINSDSCPFIDVTIFKDDNGEIKINTEIDK